MPQQREREREKIFKKSESEQEQKPEVWIKLEQSSDKTIQEMIRRGVLSLEKISNKESNYNYVTLLIKQKENGVIKEKIVNYNSRAHPSLKYAEYTEKLTYEFNSGVVIHFEKFLPEGWKLARGRDRGAGCSVVWERVEYGDLEKDLEIFYLLHEIGHVLYLEKLKKENLQEYKEALTTCEEWGNPMGWPKEKKKNILRKLAPAERNAWAIALNIFRVLKNNSLTLEKKDISLQELQEEITNCLATYQKNLKKKIFIKGSKLSEEEIKKIAKEVLRRAKHGGKEII